MRGISCVLALFFSYVLFSDEPKEANHSDKPFSEDALLLARLFLSLYEFAGQRQMVL